jgi:hypothetical protein
MWRFRVLELELTVDGPGDVASGVADELLERHAVESGVSVLSMSQAVRSKVSPEWT